MRPQTQVQGRAGGLAHRGWGRMPQVVSPWPHSDLVVCCPHSHSPRDPSEPTSGMAAKGGLEFIRRVAGGMRPVEWYAKPRAVL